MLNQLTLVGRLVRNPEVTTSNDTKYSHITIAVPRSYKNVNGEYETDFIDCTLWRGIAESTAEYCKKGDLVSIRGRLQSSVYEKDGKMVYKTDVIVEKISFLAIFRDKETTKETEEE